MRAEQVVLVQYCPCGHTWTLLGSEVTNSVKQQLKDSQRADAPMLPSSDCPVCLELRERQDRLYSELCVGWPE